MKNYSRLEMMKVFLKALNSDVVKNSEWIYGSKKRKRERERQKKCLLRATIAPASSGE
jgi:hypothetical protein